MMKQLIVDKENPEGIIVEVEETHDAEYWANISYGDAINAEIRKRYTESEEFAILRQRDEKPDEFAEYYKYCEECKAIVKQHQTTEIQE